MPRSSVLPPRGAVVAPATGVASVIFGRALVTPELPARACPVVSSCYVFRSCLCPVAETTSILINLDLRRFIRETFSGTCKLPQQLLWRKQLRKQPREQPCSLRGARQSIHVCRPAFCHLPHYPGSFLSAPAYTSPPSESELESTPPKLRAHTHTGDLLGFIR